MMLPSFITHGFSRKKLAIINVKSSLKKTKMKVLLLIDLIFSYYYFTTYNGLCGTGTRSLCAFLYHSLANDTNALTSYFGI